jgi:hypothetical protein
MDPSMWTYLVRWDNLMGVVPAWDTMKADHRDEGDRWKCCMGRDHVGEVDDIGRHREPMV